MVVLYEPGEVFTNRATQRRPYTDLSNPPCLDAFHWYPFRSSGWGTVEKGTVWFKFPFATVIGANLRHLRFGLNQAPFHLPAEA